MDTFCEQDLTAQTGILHLAGWSIRSLSGVLGYIISTASTPFAGRVKRTFLSQDVFPMGLSSRNAGMESTLAWMFASISRSNPFRCLSTMKGWLLLRVIKGKALKERERVQDEYTIGEAADVADISTKVYEICTKPGTEGGYTARVFLGRCHLAISYPYTGLSPCSHSRTNISSAQWPTHHGLDRETYQARNFGSAIIDTSIKLTTWEIQYRVSNTWLTPSQEVTTQVEMQEKNICL